LRVLFFIGHDGFIRNFEKLIRARAARGDEVHLAASSRRVALMSDARSLEDLCESDPRITFDRIPKDRDNAAGPLLDLLATSRSYLRFYGPEYADAPALRERAKNYVPPAMRSFLRYTGGHTRPGRWAYDRMLLGLIEGMPTSPAFDEYIAGHRPDVVLVTPLVSMQGVAQLSAVASARKAGIPSALLVHSWDNLTNKGLIHTPPDRVAVWNDAQKREAIELHRVPEDQVVVTGAHSYDHWFDWAPSKSRQAFCRDFGLDPEQPFVVYMCSSAFIAPDEVSLVRKWVTALRASDDQRLRDVGVLVRPHPQNTEQWESVRPGDLDGAVVYRPGASAWAGSTSRADYYDSMHHAAAVVGLNTTALIESAILERPVLTWLTPEFRDTQEGTLHFQHIASDQGLLLVARTFEEHEAQLGEVLSEPDRADRSRRFVEEFVRPYGLDDPGTPRLVSMVTGLAEKPPARRRRKLSTVLLWPFGRLFLLPGLIRRAGRRPAPPAPAKQAVREPLTPKEARAAARAKKAKKRTKL
jgi:hypothetical protein